MPLSLQALTWPLLIALVIDVVALISIWTSRAHSSQAKVLWTVIVAALPFLGAMAWFPLGWERRRRHDSGED